MAAIGEPLRWAVLTFRFDPTQGHEQGGIRRAVVVSYEPSHRSGMATVCPISAARSEARYPGEVPIQLGEAGQTRPGVVLCQQVRTVALSRAVGTGGPVDRVTDPRIRRAIRQALLHHLGLDLPPMADGAAVT